MFLELEKKGGIMVLGLLGWALIVFFTFFNIQKIFSRSCYFLSYWPFCESVVSNLEIIRGLVLVLTFLIFGFFNYFLFKFFFGGNKLFSWLAVVVILLLGVLSLPFGSNDFQFYFSLGRVVGSGINPYLQSWNVQNTFFYPQSVNSVEGVMYGPLALSIFRFFYMLSGGNLINFVLLWKILMLAVLFTCGFLIAKICNITMEDRKTFYLFWLVSPLLLFEWVGNGHFDGVWLLFLFLAFIFARRNWWGMVVISLVIGIWVKFIPLLIAPWFLLWWWQEVDKNNWFSRLVSVLVGVLISAMVTILGWWPYWQGFEVFKPIILQSKWAVHGLFATFYYSLEPLFLVLFDHRSHWFLTRFLHGLIFALVVYFLWPLLKGAISLFLRKAKWDLKEFSVAIFVSLFVYLFIWQKSFWPWYSIWVIAIGIISYLLTKNIHLGKILLWLSSVSLFFYIPWVFFGGNVTDKLFNWYVVVLVFIYPLMQLFSWRKVNFNLYNVDLV